MKYLVLLIIFIVARCDSVEPEPVPEPLPELIVDTTATSHSVYLDAEYGVTVDAERLYAHWRDTNDSLRTARTKSGCLWLLCSAYVEIDDIRHGTSISFEYMNPTTDSVKASVTCTFQNYTENSCDYPGQVQFVDPEKLICKAWDQCQGSSFD